MRRITLIAVGVAVFIAFVWWLYSMAPTSTAEPATQSNSSLPSKPDWRALSAESASTEPGSELIRTASTSANPRISHEASEAPEQEQLDKCRSTLVEWFKNRDDAESLLAAAALTASFASPSSAEADRKASAMLSRAVQLAPSDPAIRWLAVSICNRLRDCDHRDHERALRELEPTNAAGWVYALQRASLDSSADRAAKLDEILRSIANSTTLDLLWLDRHTKIERALANARVAPPQGVRDCVESLHVAAIGAEELPSFSTLVDACHAPVESDRVSECRALGRAMRAGDSILVQAIGFRISAAAARGSEEESELKRERRRFEWIRAQVRQLDERGQRDMLRLMREHTREIDVFTALLQENGIPLEPPADWMNEQPTRN